MYNIGGWNELPNIVVVRTIPSLLDEMAPKKGSNYADQINFAEDRPGHDRRYRERGPESTSRWWRSRSPWWRCTHGIDLLASRKPPSQDEQFALTPNPSSRTPPRFTLRAPNLE